jgi:hypothetical protein
MFFVKQDLVRRLPPELFVKQGAAAQQQHVKYMLRTLHSALEYGKPHFCFSQPTLFLLSYSDPAACRQKTSQQKKWLLPLSTTRRRMMTKWQRTTPL